MWAIMEYSTGYRISDSDNVPSRITSPVHIPGTRSSAVPQAPAKKKRRMDTSESSKTENNTKQVNKPDEEEAEDDDVQVPHGDTDDGGALAEFPDFAISILERND